MKNIGSILQVALFRILETGAKHIKDVVVKHRIIYFNSILLALPLVYVVFVLLDVPSYLRPLNTWYFDQFGFFIFVGICLICYVLNYIKKSRISKTLFIISWPLIMHIIPIIILNTPPDYYYAYPMGMIFHSIMIQVIFCFRKNPFYFWPLLITNFLLVVYSIDFLKYFDTDEQSAISRLAAEQYYALVIILYWLLFNMVVFYLMRIIDTNLVRAIEAKNIIEVQKNELEDALGKLKKSQNQLIQSEKLASLGVFTAGLSHELNNPINYIVSGASGLFDILDLIVTDEMRENPEYKIELRSIDKTREAIDKGVDRAISIISSLRNYANPGNEGFKEYNCVNCIKDSLTLLSSSIKNHIKITEDFPKEINIVCNAGRMNQVFFNLLNNAIQAITGGGIINISAWVTDNDKAVFEIKDTGCGIKKDNIKKIFDPFYTTREIGKGTGLGLYIVHNTVEEHKGKIEVESEVNKGTLFRIILPVRH